jgi:mono/diheme cytochrome c family protein
MNPETHTPSRGATDAPELKIERRSVPVWILILLLLLIYWGMLYFDQHGGWFSQEVYTPYRSVAELEYYQLPKDEGESLLLQGKDLFSKNCAVCHMENGVGNPANGCPPLVGSEWVAAPGAARIVRIVSKGLVGPIEVKGQAYGTGTMLAIGDALPGDEKEKAQNIAAIISYIRKTFGNNAPAVKPEYVEGVRATIKDRNTPFTADELKKIPDTD